MSEETPESTDPDFSLTDEQEAALALDHNVAITAGAGTGKTTTLTERYMHILEERPDVGPENVVTITFTNDAANELQERIRGAVSERLADASPGEYERWRAVKDDLGDGYIHTIHGFCSRVLREEVVDAPVTPDFEVYDETDATVLAREVVRRTLDDQLAGGELEVDVERLAHLWTRETLENVLVGLFGERPESETWSERWRDASPDEYLDFVWDTVHPISPEFAEDVFSRPPVRDAFETIRELESSGLLTDVSPADDDGAETVSEVTRLLDDYEPLTDAVETRARQRFLDDLCDYLTTNDGDRDGRDWKYWGSAGRWGDAGRQDEQDRLADAVETLLTEIDPEALEFGTAPDESSAHYVLALARLFDAAHKDYEATKDNQNAVDYDDLVETTISFLEETSHVRDRLRDQFEYVMVDEVQDTDPRQWELVQLLTSENLDDFDAQNVFMVGDEKQSIYRFRGADVTSFADARAELDAANPDDTTTNLELSGNFRTTDETLAFCNDLFDEERVFAPFDDEYAPFETRPQALTPERAGGREIAGQSEYMVVPDDDYEALHEDGYLEETPQFVESGEREAYAVVSRLTQLFDESPQVYDEDAAETRPAEPEDVTILLRSRSRLKAYERALDAYDVPYTVVSGTGYYDTPEITALLNLLRVLENPRDEIALYGLLRSPLFGIPDKKLANLRLADGDLWDALSAANGDLGDAYELLTSWRRLAGTHAEVSAESTTPWGTLISRIIDDTGFIAAVAGDERPRQGAVNVNRFREQVRRWEEAGVKTIAELRSRLELRQEVEGHADEARIPEDADGVQIRTIHSSKGLEFPITVVPELGTQFNFQANVDDNGKVYFDEIDFARSGGRDPVLGLKTPTPDDAFAREDTLVRRVTRDRVREHDRAELKRLLYVAATRTRDHLILSGIHEIEETGSGFELGEPNDPAEANCWRDWTQPALLDEDVLEELSDRGSVDRSLPNSEYTVTRPMEPVADREQSRNQDDVSLAIDIPEPDPQQRPFVLSATAYASLRSGSEGMYLEGSDEVADTSDPAEDGLAATTLGTIVHRICETRLERESWRRFAKEVAEREGETLTEDALERIGTYAERAIEFVDSHEAELEVLSRRDEVSVAARFDHGRIVGDIDHLAVTPDAFHVVDYKTNDTSERSVDDLAEHYWPQLQAYAVALHQSIPNKTVHLALYFTEAGEKREQTISPTRMDEIESSMSAMLSDRVSPERFSGNE
jgi:ATP-dependent helicase/nuclease subunit A